MDMRDTDTKDTHAKNTSGRQPSVGEPAASVTGFDLETCRVTQRNLASATVHVVLPEYYL